MRLQVRHMTGSSSDGKQLFQVEYDGRHGSEVELTSPWERYVGATNMPLRDELRRYLEKYLQMPDSLRDERVLRELSVWGIDCFEKLFNSGGSAQNWYQQARTQPGRLSRLRIVIASDDASVLSWPWEALESSQDGRLAIQCRIERQLNKVGDVLPLPPLPEDTLRILYIIPRPANDKLEYQTQARALIDFIEKEGWPVHVDVLRPPTFGQLQAVLDKKTYHIVHFDGHGNFSGGKGQLVFENDDANHSAAHIDANTLGELLREYSIPVMVLDACRSAMMNEAGKTAPSVGTPQESGKPVATDETGEDVFASVATSLLKAGVRSVVANGYSIYASGAKIFVPPFYRQLFQTGSVSAAMNDGRRAMFSDKQRNTSTGKTEFHDWLVPVLYQQGDDKVLPIIQPGKKRESTLPPELQDRGIYGFIGRDRYVLQIERALHRRPAGILIHGMAGEGKTTLARGFLQWLENTNGLGGGVFWFSFEERQSAENILSTLVRALISTNATAWPIEQKLAAATEYLSSNLPPTG